MRHFVEILRERMLIPRECLLTVGREFERMGEVCVPLMPKSYPAKELSVSSIRQVLGFCEKLAKWERVCGESFALSMTPEAVTWHEKIQVIPMDP